MIKNFNDSFALWLTGLIIMLWILNGAGYIELSGEVSGSLVPVFMAIAYFYFRKKADESK